MSNVYPSLSTPLHSRRLTSANVILIVIMLVSAFFELFQLDQEGYANTYYAAAVQSMLTSWHNFFFVSYDSAGFVSLDKPPLGFWIQAASAKLLGFSGFSLLLPEALAAIASVALLYLLVARVFGQSAGLCAALVLALTPISVVVARNNTIDSLLILVLLLAVYYVSRAVETGSVYRLLVCAFCIGLG
ncbi:MAG TPA: glycosyltransferase family 39 protein, partial [Ktedonobacteraceae bacterium]|nr:glycosyltransferase family 39 protein [Ktedonobacteraceae bacterium]